MAGPTCSDVRGNNSSQSNMKGFVMKFMMNVSREAEDLQSKKPEGREIIGCGACLEGVVAAAMATDL